MGGTTAPFLKMCGIQMGTNVVEKHEVPKLSPWMEKTSVRLQKILCNYSKDGDGIDDRYQTEEYTHEGHSHESDLARTNLLSGGMREDDSPELEATVKCTEKSKDNDEKSSIRSWTGASSAGTKEEITEGEKHGSSTKVVPI